MELTDTCSQSPWAANGLSGETRVPATFSVTKVTAVSLAIDFRVKWNPCLREEAVSQGLKAVSNLPEPALYAEWENGGCVEAARQGHRPGVVGRLEESGR